LTYGADGVMVGTTPVTARWQQPSPIASTESPMPDQSAPLRHRRSPARQAPFRAAVLTLVVAALAIGPEPAAAAPTAPPPAARTTSTAAADLTIAMTQTPVSYDATTNKSRIRVTVTPTGAENPYSWAVAVRGTTVASGSSSDASVSATVTNDCSITTMSLTSNVTDNLGRTAGASSTLDRSLCPPTPNYPHARDKILAGPTLTEDSFVDRLRAVGSPALSEGRAIYRTLVNGGVNVAFALGTFHAESHSGTRGYAVTTKNWGNILYYAWEVQFGATPYAPGNGYTYAKYKTWLDSVKAYVYLLNRYWTLGYRTVSSASAHWLGTIEGSDRHLRYLTNIVNVMSILPDDAVPVMTSLTVPTTSRAVVNVSWTAKDNLAVTGYALKYRKGTNAWQSGGTTAARSKTFTLTTGTWTIAVRATDAAGNWSRWMSDTVRVDAGIPTMTSLRVSQTVVRTADARFTAAWAGTDNVGVTRYQWRYRKSPDGTASAITSTTGRGATFRFAPGTWFIDVRARDAVGNASPWRSVRVIVPRDDRAFTFSEGTSRRTGSTFYRGTLTTTNVKDATLTTTSADGNGFVLIGRVGPSYGKLEITVDGVATVIDTGYLAGKRATAITDRVLLFSTRFAAGPHSVTIRNLGTTGRPTIAVDGLGFSR
jgi:hypothetical protein